MRVLIEEGLTQAERVFNLLGCLPIVSIFSGIVRTIAGRVQFIVGAIFALVGTLHYLAHYHSTCFQLGIEYMIHGGLNTGRGILEMLLGLTIVGSIIPLSCQMLSDPSFRPQFPYTTQRRYYAL